MNITYGSAPGESQIASVMSQLNSNDQRMIDRQIQRNQTDVARQQQDEQFNKQLNLQKILGGINAGVNIASAATGMVGAIPGIVEGFRNLSGPTARQIQRDQFAQGQKLQERQLQAHVMAQGAQAGIELAKVAALQEQRGNQRQLGEASYGNDLMMQDIPEQHHQYLLDSAAGGDPVARQQAMKIGLLTYTDYQQQKMNDVQRKLDTLESNRSTVTPEEYAFTKAELSTQLAGIQNSPVRGRAITPQQDAASHLVNQNLANEDGSISKVRLLRTSRGEWKPFETNDDKMKYEVALDRAKKQNDIDLGIATPGQGKSRKGSSRSGGSSAADASELSVADVHKNIVLPMIEAREAAWKASMAKRSAVEIAQNPNPTPPDFTPSSDEIAKAIASISIGQSKAKDMIATYDGIRSATDVNPDSNPDGRVNLFQMRGFNGAPASMEQQLPEGLGPNSAPSDLPTAAAIGNTLPMAGVGAGIVQEPSLDVGNNQRVAVAPGEIDRGQPSSSPEPKIQPGQLPVPPAKVNGSMPTLQGPQNGSEPKPQYKQSTDAYIKSLDSVRLPPGAKQSFIIASGTNVAKQMGLDKIAVVSDANGEIPVITSRDMLAKYHSLARKRKEKLRYMTPDGSTFVTN